MSRTSWARYLQLISSGPIAKMFFFLNLPRVPAGWIRLLSRSQAGRIYFLRLSDGTKSFTWPGEALQQLQQQPATSMQEQGAAGASTEQLVDSSFTLPNCMVSAPASSRPPQDSRESSFVDCTKALPGLSRQLPEDSQQVIEVESADPWCYHENLSTVADAGRTANMCMTDGGISPHVIGQPMLGSSQLVAPGNDMHDGVHQGNTNPVDCSGAMTPNVPPAPRPINTHCRQLADAEKLLRMSDMSATPGCMTPALVVCRPPPLPPGSATEPPAALSFTLEGNAYPWRTDFNERTTGTITP